MFSIDIEKEAFVMLLFCLWDKIGDYKKNKSRHNRFFLYYFYCRMAHRFNPDLVGIETVACLDEG
jgi:hypothetical protein